MASRGQEGEGGRRSTKERWCRPLVSLHHCAGSLARAADRSIGAHSDTLLSWRGEVEVERRRGWRLEILEEERRRFDIDILAARDRMQPGQVGGRRLCGLVVLHHPAGKPAHMAALLFAPLFSPSFIKAGCQQS